MSTTGTKERKKWRHLIAVKLSMLETEAIMLAYPPNNNIGLRLLTALLGAVLDRAGIPNHTLDDTTELNQGLILIEADTLGQPLEIVRAQLEKLAIGKVSHIGWMDVRESGLNAHGKAVLHWRRYPEGAHPIDFNELIDDTSGQKRAWLEARQAEMRRLGVKLSVKTKTQNHSISERTNYED